MYMSQEVGCPFSEVNTSQLAASHYIVHDGSFLSRIMVPQNILSYLKEHKGNKCCR